MKPMLAEDWDPLKQRYPVLIQPKIDGVRALNLFGTLTGRSLKKFGNRYVTALFSHSLLIGFDGEMAVGSNSAHPDLCRMTTSALSTITGEPVVTWHLFDYVTSETRHLPYANRLDLLRRQVDAVQLVRPDLHARLAIVPTYECRSEAGLQCADEYWTGFGYEGTIIRAIEAPHKSGRSTVKEGGLLRVKAFATAEAEVVAVHEGQTNLNEATVNELGLTERSTHQENMVANGLVGTLTGKLLASIQLGDKVLPKGELVTISAGRMTAEERKLYLQEPGRIVGKVATFQYFPRGVKDKLRFPTFQGLRMQEDMS